MLIYGKNIFAICLIYLVVFTQAYSIFQTEDIKIEQTADKWRCDMIECPLDSERCFVSKSNEEEPSVLKRVNICFSKDNTILAESNTSSPINPALQIRQYINSYRGGSTTSTGSSHGTAFNQAAFAEKVNQNIDNVNRNIESQMNNLQNSLRDMQNRLANMFGHSI